MSAPVEPPLRERLRSLAHELGREDRGFALLGEGNVSALVDADTFVVKASGSNLATLTDGGLTTCRRSACVDLLDDTAADDSAVGRTLLASRLDEAAAKPSVEAMFHAWLLGLPGVKFVGHTHPVAVNALLCSERATDFANRRLFPDEIVCCGPESVLVPYVDPGLELARAIRTAVEVHLAAHGGEVPRVILLENHGLIALGTTPAAVLAATLMAEKAARITLGACAAGGPSYLAAASVARIAGRTDEHERQKALGI